MTDAPKLPDGAEYIVFYVGGPNDGQNDTRISTDGGFDDEITILAAVDGKETLIDYNLGDYKEVGGQYQVTYTWDEKDSEALEDPEDRGGRA